MRIFLLVIILSGCTSNERSHGGYTTPEPCGENWLCPGDPRCELDEHKFLCEKRESSK